MASKGGRFVRVWSGFTHLIVIRVGGDFLDERICWIFVPRAGKHILSLGAMYADSQRVDVGAWLVAGD